MFYLSVHGGGSKIEILAFNEKCEILGRGCSGGINNYFEPYQSILQHISEAIVQCVLSLYSYGFTGQFECAYCCLVGRPSDLQECFLQVGYEIKEYVLLPEQYCYLLAGSLSETGCVALSGTGSCTAYYNGRDDFLVTGGYGTPIGDDGSSTYIGIRGINMVTRAIGGWGEKTILYDFLCESLGRSEDRVDTVRLVQILYPEGTLNRRPIYTAFSRQVVRAASCGDQVAISVLTEAGELMARQMLSAYRLYQMGARGIQNLIYIYMQAREQGLVDLCFDRAQSAPDIYACGSTWSGNPVMYRAFTAYVKQYLPDARCIAAERTAVYGGLVYFAIERYGRADFKKALHLLTEAPSKGALENHE